MNNFKVTEPNAFNVNRLLTINRARDGHYNENEGEDHEDEQKESGYYNYQGYYRNPN